MPTAYIALGSNLGDRAETLSSATDRLDRLGRVTAHSSLYETEPVGYRDQPGRSGDTLGAAALIARFTGH
jgi:2-amino-4-hydroxy-6-hydroxymethyldihydropteridine diphosphokinase